MDAGGFLRFNLSAQGLRPERYDCEGYKPFQWCHFRFPLLFLTGRFSAGKRSVFRFALDPEVTCFIVSWVTVLVVNILPVSLTDPTRLLHFIPCATSSSTFTLLLSRAMVLGVLLFVIAGHIT